MVTTQEIFDSVIKQLKAERFGPNIHEWSVCKYCFAPKSKHVAGFSCATEASYKNLLLFCEHVILRRI